MTSEICEQAGREALEDGMGYIGAYGLFLGSVGGAIIAALGITFSSWNGGPSTGISNIGVAIGCYLIAALLAFIYIKETLIARPRRLTLNYCYLIPTLRPFGRDSIYSSNFKWTLSAFMAIDAYFISIVINYLLWKELMTYFYVYLYAVMALLCALPAVRLITRRLGAVQTVRFALACYAAMVLLLALAPSRSVLGLVQAWFALPFLGIAYSAIPAFQSILYSQCEPKSSMYFLSRCIHDLIRYPIDERAEVVSWYKMMAVGIPKAIGSAFGGTILSVCMNQDPECRTYLMGIIPFAPLLLGTAFAIILYNHNEKAHGDESQYKGRFGAVDGPGDA
jgi:hypothetical protein